MMRKKKEPGYHFRNIIKLPDILTLANAFCGFLATVFILYRSFTIAMILLPLAFIFDLFNPGSHNDKSLDNKEN